MNLKYYTLKCVNKKLHLDYGVVNNDCKGFFSHSIKNLFINYFKYFDDYRKNKVSLDLIKEFGMDLDDLETQTKKLCNELVDDYPEKFI